MKTCPINIQEANEAFEKLSLEEKKIAIAKDVILQVQTEKYVANSGVYTQFKEPVFGLDPEAADVSFQDILHDSKVPACSVCARGALFLSIIRKDNKMDLGTAFGDMGNRVVCTEPSRIRAEKRFFEYEEIQAIECAFEGWFCEDIHVNGREWGYMYEDDKDRLIAIMENIIRNNGTFKIDDLQ